MSAALDARGLKRVCAGCGVRFYDLNKRPIICPGCSVEFSSEIKLKARRGRAAIAEAIAEAPVGPVANDQFEEVEATADTVSLEEIEEDADDDADDQIEDGDDIADIEDLEDNDNLEDEIGKVEKD